MRRTISEILKNLAALSVLLLVVLFVAGVGQGIRKIVDSFDNEDREDTTLSANSVTYSVMLSLNKTNVEDAAVSPDWMAPHAYSAFTKLGLLNSNLLDSAISDAFNTVSNSILAKVDVEAFNVYTNTAEIDRIVLTNALQVETSNRILEDLSLGDIITVTSNSLFVALWQEMQDREIADLGLSSQIDSVSNWVDNAVVDIWENFSMLDYRFSSSTNDLWEAFAFEGEMSLFGDLILSNSIVDVQSDMYSISNEFSNAMAQEREHRILGDSLGSNHVHSVELALSNRLDSVELALTGTSNDLAHAISTETQSRVAGDAANHNEIVGVQEYAESVSNKFDSAVYVLATNLNTKVSTNHFGDVTIHGGIVVTDNIYMGAGKTPVLTNELDPSWSAVSNTVTQNAIQGSMAYGWGNHAAFGYLTNELDPLAYPVATNALAMAKGALQPNATNGLPVAVEHAGSEHGVVVSGGFAGGTGATSTRGGAVGNYASATYGGAVGAGASATYGGAVGAGASATYGGAVGAGAMAMDGGAVGSGAVAMDGGGAVGNYASATYGGAVGYFANATDGGGAMGAGANATEGGGAVGYGAATSRGFAGGYQAIAALDNTGYGQTIDAIQLGTGWNPDPNTLQIYGHKLLNADGSIPAERMAATLSAYATAGAVAAVQAEVAGKVSTNHVGDVVVTGNVSATSFIGDGSQLSGVSGGVEFPELTLYTTNGPTLIPFTKEYKYYNVLVTNSTDVSFDYSGIGDFTGSVLEFQIRLALVNPADAVTIPAEGVSGIKYVGDIDISATQANTVQHLGMMMYSTNNVLLSHWFFDEPEAP